MILSSPKPALVDKSGLDVEKRRGIRGTSGDPPSKTVRSGALLNSTGLFFSYRSLRVDYMPMAVRQSADTVEEHW